MKLLLDTHVLAWWVFDDARLPPATRELIGVSDEVFVSAVSAYEISRKYHLGKWPEAEPLIDGFERIAAAESFSILGLKALHAINAGKLPGEHRDPFDRLIAAQASTEGMGLVSADKVLRHLGLEPIWR